MILVVGASGATGRQLTEHLLNKEQNVKIIVRSAAKLPDHLKNHKQLKIAEASLLNLSDAELAEVVKDCSAVASCLGHVLSFQGIYGQPLRLVTDAVRRLCTAIKANAPAHPVRFVLMNTAGNSNRDLNERVSLGEKIIIGLLRLLLPPHVDNEQAADYLRTQIGQNNSNIEWAVVRPDTLIDEDRVTEYEVHQSPIRSAIFNAGKTSRINVGHFMSELITNDDLWNRWKGQMPVIYNKEK